MNLTLYISDDDHIIVQKCKAQLEAEGNTLSRMFVESCKDHLLGGDIKVRRAARQLVKELVEQI